MASICSVSSLHSSISRIAVLLALDLGAIFKDAHIGQQFGCFSTEKQELQSLQTYSIYNISFRYYYIMTVVYCQYRKINKKCTKMRRRRLKNRRRFCYLCTIFKKIEKLDNYSDNGVSIIMRDNDDPLNMDEDGSMYIEDNPKILGVFISRYNIPLLQKVLELIDDHENKMEVFLFLPHYYYRT